MNLCASTQSYSRLTGTPADELGSGPKRALLFQHPCLRGRLFIGFPPNSRLPRAQHMASLHFWQRLPLSNPANPTAALGRSPSTTHHKWQRRTAQQNSFSELRNLDDFKELIFALRAFVDICLTSVNYLHIEQFSPKIGNHSF